MTDQEMTIAGNMIAESLYLKRDKEYPDRWRTDWGTKTGKGLYLTLQRMLVEAEQQAKEWSTINSNAFEAVTNANP